MLAYGGGKKSPMEPNMVKRNTRKKLLSCAGRSKRWCVRGCHPSSLPYAETLSEFTHILERVEHGDPKAAAELLPVVYEELRRQAAQKMANEAAGHTLQATALVHEAWMRLGGSDAPTFQTRAHFFCAAAEAMRRTLVEHARRRLAAKRGARHEGVCPARLQIASPLAAA